MSLETNIIKIKNDDRWVVYSKSVEATKITTEWYLWMHHTSNNIPDEKKKKIYLAKETPRESNWH